MDVASGKHPGSGTLGHLGEKIEIDEQLFNAFLIAIQYASVLIRAGSGARKEAGGLMSHGGALADAFSHDGHLQRGDRHWGCW